MPQENKADIEEISSQEGLGWMILTVLCTINEAIDYIGLILNLTGIWEVIILIIDLLTLALIILWKILQGDIKSILNKKTILFIVSELIPVAGDIVPGWLLTMILSLRKKGPRKIRSRKEKKVPPPLHREIRRMEMEGVIPTEEEIREARKERAESGRPFGVEMTRPEVLREKREMGLWRIKHGRPFAKGIEEMENERKAMKRIEKKVRRERKMLEKMIERKQLRRIRISFKEAEEKDEIS